MSVPFQSRDQSSGSGGSSNDARPHPASVPGVNSAAPISLETSGDENLVQLYRTKLWLLGQIKETKAAYIAAQNKAPPSSNDPEKLSESVTRLQVNLLEISTNNSLKELLFSRLQLGHALEKHLFPPPPAPLGTGDAQQTDDSQRKLLPLVEKQVELASEVLRLHKVMETMKPDLEKKRKTKLELMQHNRELMARIQQAKEDIVGKKKHSASEAVQRAQQKLEDILSKITLVQHCFQGVVVSSGINWAKDPDMMELVVSLGQPPPLDS